MNDIERWMDSALAFRMDLLDPEHTGAARLFNGYVEGLPGLVADIYGRTLVLFIASDLYQQNPDLVKNLQEFYLARVPWIACVLYKVRSASDDDLRLGQISYGTNPDQQVSEHGVRYKLDLCLNQDASFYLETRLLRLWLKEHASGWRILNTFAYTGSLGVAALAGGAGYVVQVDRSQKYLALARQSAVCSKLDLGRMKLRNLDFYQVAAELKRNGELFDCVILDPPFFSATDFGRVNLSGETSRLINKVRPLIRDQGWLVSINNALFYSGVNYLAELELLCEDGYLSIEKLFDVPADVIGFANEFKPAYPAEPSPFNHPTKIALLKVNSRHQKI